jgi:O-antigen ligase
LPLYLVIAAGVVSFGYRTLAPRERHDAGDSAQAWGGPMSGETPLITWLLRAIAATLVLYAIQTAYSVHVSNAIENAAFFLVPFAVMFVLLTEVHWTPRLLGRVLLAVAGLGLLLAGIAFWEYAARDLLLSRGHLLQSNQLHIYFRVNSLFYDPNVFGRYLALALVALGAYLAWSRGTRGPVVVAAVAGVLLAALALSYSITSFGALVAGLLVVAALRWSVRWAFAGGAAILVCGAVFLLVSGTGEEDLGTARNFDTTTSGRVDLVRGGLELAQDRPLWGWGSGSFGAAFSRQIERARTTVSHSEPITVAAEQGAIGLVVYSGLLALALVVLLSGAGASAGAAAAGACFVAMLVHSLSYAGFAIDPATWALLGVGVALRRSRSVPATVPAAVGDRSVVPPRRRRPAAV